MSSHSESRLTIREIVNLEDPALESVRVVRNSCRKFMTRDQSEISIEGQRQWFPRRGATNLFAFLQEEETVGYGLIASRGRWWLSGGLLPKERNKGLGAEIFNYLLNYVQVGWLEVLTENHRAWSLYGRLGFVVVKKDKRVLTMVADRT